MPQLTTDGKELVEVKASVQISFSPAASFATALEAAILRQAWAQTYPGLAQELTTYLLNGLEDLLQDYPVGVSAETLNARIGELASNFPGFASLADQLEGVEYDEGYEQLKRIITEQWGWEEEDFKSFWTRIWEQVGGDPDISAAMQANDFGWFISIIEDRYSYLLPTGWQEFNEVSFQEDLINLNKLIVWNPGLEQKLIQVCRNAVYELKQRRIRIGGQTVSVPFKFTERFDAFLQKMDERQRILGDLAKTYFGESHRWDWLNKTLGNSFYFKLLEKALGVGANFAWDFSEEVGRPLAEWSPLVPDEWADFPQDAFIWELTKVFEISQLGTNFQVVLANDPVMALAGMASGMVEASPLGMLLDIGSVYVSGAFAQANQYGADLPTIEPGWWHSVIGTDSTNEAFQAGREIGQFGMSVSDIVVGIHSVPGSTTLSGGSMGAVPGGNGVLAWANGVMSIEAAQALGLIGGGYGVAYLAELPSDDDSNIDLSNVTSEDFHRRLEKAADTDFFELRGYHEAEWELIGDPVFGGKLANEDPTTGPGYRYYATFEHYSGERRITLSINYNPETGQFGAIKRSSGKP